MQRRTFFGIFLAALGIALYPKPPIDDLPKPPTQIWRDRYNDPPDPTLHQQIFS